MSDKTTTPEPLVSVYGMQNAWDDIIRPRVRNVEQEQGSCPPAWQAGELGRHLIEVYEKDRRSHLSRIQELEDQVKALGEAGGAMYHFLGSELFGTTYSGHSPLTLVQNWRLLTKPDAASKPSNTNTGS